MSPKGVQILVTHPGGVKERLMIAYVDGIQYIKPENVPEKYRLQLNQIHEIMQGTTPPEDPWGLPKGAIERAVELMTIDDAIDVARTIFGLYDSVIHASHERDQGDQ